VNTGKKRCFTSRPSSLPLFAEMADADVTHVIDRVLDLAPQCAIPILP